MFRPEGIYPAMLTPFDANHDINEKELRRFVEFCIQKGLHGLFPVSSSGEFIHMNYDQKVRCMEIVMDQANGRVKVTPGIGSSTPAEAVRLGKVAISLGCDGVVVSPPYYYKVCDGVLEEYYSQIIDSLDIPVIVYNIPGFTQPIPYDMVGRLACRDNVVGMKDSSGSMIDCVNFIDAIKQAGAELNFLSGREDILLPVLHVGGKGCMVQFAGVFPEVLVSLWTAFQENRYEDALAIHNQAITLISTMLTAQFPLGGKIVLGMRGFDFGPSLQPLNSAEKARHAQLTERLAELAKPFIDQYGVYEG